MAVQAGQVPVTVLMVLLFMGELVVMIPPRELAASTQAEGVAETRVVAMELIMAGAEVAALILLEKREVVEVGI